MDDDLLVRVKDLLERSERVDAARIQVDAEGSAVVLKGSVADAAEASAAALLAEQVAPDVVSRLRVDRGLREGLERPQATEQVIPAENEVLVGNTDMLAGPDAAITSDISRSLEENEPWDPPDEPTLAPTAAEYRQEVGIGDGGLPVEEPDPSAVPQAERSLADVTQQELEGAARGGVVPSLDPDRVAEDPLPSPDPVGVDSLGSSPPEDLDPMVEQVPGTPQGPGAVGEGTAGGGSTSGVPATETGSLGADTRAADPVRSGTGGTMTDTGTERGPEAREDPPLREDFPSSDPPSEG